MPHPRNLADTSDSTYLNKMIETKITVFSIMLEVYFLRPRPFSKDKMDLLAEWLTDPLKGLGLRPDQVRVRHTDIIFDYELAASFYGGNASIVYNAEKAILSARGARTRQDAELLHSAAVKFAQFVASEENLPIGFSANAHATLPTIKDRELYLDALRPHPRVTNPGALGYINVEGWADTIRIAIEPSLSEAQSLFFTWQTTIEPSLEWKNTPEKLIGVIEDVTSIFDIQFQPLLDQ